MDTDFSKDAFFKFLDYLSDKNLVKFQTVRGWRSAASKLMEDLSEAEEADVRTLDIEIAVHRTANRDSGSISPKSLNTYRQRVAIAIAEFVRRQEDPAGYKPRTLNGQSRTKPTNGSSSRAKAASEPATAPKKHDKEPAHLSSGLTLSYPLRTDFLAQVVIPRDLNTVEARRLGAFLLTIAVDYQPD
ncbi:hypothetical protein IQ254_28225 [Nodosilinea sp. LEGE 07088]|uniref:hypothetical protein n=1 Tax=Nodosilinea sp. LEGE 07088 TaxID=2777968 RepID=UPI00187F4404|nr:hypothetical protein [Nodosilinea sp. LEGE 07088]MBE9141040.1 hypothetical protein [Nodosilinea sp. LEGE 07088]